jgi:hypothetical protein
MVLVRSDGNGGTHSPIKPVWWGIILSGIMLLSNGLTCYGTRGSEAAVNREKLTVLEKGRAENRALIDKMQECQTVIDHRLTAIETDINWISQSLGKK